MKTLLVFGTKYGCTEKCARLLASKLSGSTTVVNVSEKIPALSDYDCVIIGGSVYVGKIQPAVKEFCEKNLEQLAPKKLGLFICAANVEQSEEQLKQNFPAPLVEAAQACGHFGFAIQMAKMNFMERTAVKMIMKTRESTENILEDNIARFAAQLALG